mgnify:CR=1 FL=1
MDLGLGEKAAVVLGSSSGLGLAAARALLEEGASVAVSGRDPERLERARAALASHGSRVFAAPLDVTDRHRLEAHVRAAAQRFGRPIQILVTNAGGPPAASALEIDDQGLQRSFELTLRSAIHAVQAVLPAMRAARWGRIVALTSSSVRVPIPSLVYSSTMRAGLTAYLKSLAGEVAREGVLVNSICAGGFATEHHEEVLAARGARRGRSLDEERAQVVQPIPLGRLGRPEEFGDLVAFLCSERCSFLAGVALAYDGGANPGLL